jgi:hypothetical protein
MQISAPAKQENSHHQLNELPPLTAESYDVLVEVEISRFREAGTSVTSRLARLSITQRRRVTRTALHLFTSYCGLKIATQLIIQIAQRHLSILSQVRGSFPPALILTATVDSRHTRSSHTAPPLLQR